MPKKIQLILQPCYTSAMNTRSLKYPAHHTPSVHLLAIRIAAIGILATFWGPACAIPDMPDAGNDSGLTATDAGIPPKNTPFVPDAPYGNPSTTLVSRVGRDDTLDVATWNIENFPKGPGAAQVVAELIASLDLDLVVIEEITDEDAFNEIDARLPYHYSELSSHTYSDGSAQKVGLLYRADLLNMDSFSLLFNRVYEFPRPVIRAHFTVIHEDFAPFDFTVLGLHLKAGVQDEDRARRIGANLRLEEFVRGQVAGSADDDILLLGDFNEVLTTSAGRNVFSPWADANLYKIHTQRLSDENKGSFIPGNRLIDHIISTRSFDNAVSGYLARIPPLTTEMPSYENNVSDHLPVMLPIPLQPAK